MFHPPPPHQKKKKKKREDSLVCTMGRPALSIHSHLHLALLPHSENPIAVPRPARRTNNDSAPDGAASLPSSSASPSSLSCPDAPCASPGLAVVDSDDVAELVLVLELVASFELVTPLSVNVAAEVISELVVVSLASSPSGLMELMGPPMPRPADMTVCVSSHLTNSGGCVNRRTVTVTSGAITDGVGSPYTSEGTHAVECTMSP